MNDISSIDIKNIEQFDQIQKEISSVNYSLSVITWDQQTFAPSIASNFAGEVIAYLSKQQQNLLTSDYTNKVLLSLKQLYDNDVLDYIHKHEYRFLSREIEQHSRIPSSLVADFNKLLNDAYPVWREAKATNSYQLFAPWIQKIFDSMRKQAQYIYPDWDPYDVWLDQFDRGNTSKTLDPFFDLVKQNIIPLVKQIQSIELSHAVQNDVQATHKLVPINKQQELANKLIRVIGIDPQRFTFGRTEHPFTLALSRDDVRVAHHFHEHDVIAGIFTTIHEGGHSLYEQNIDPAYNFTCLSGGASAGIHESQSRLMENMIGRSRPFMDVLLPLLQQTAPKIFDDFTPDRLYTCINVVQPTLIRTEADELTYTLHIMVRYEVERELMNGRISVDDAPKLWNSLTKEYLGIDVPNDTVGILQDMHWAIGDVGYFASYGIGNAYAAQFVAHARADAKDKGVDVDACISQGDLTPITGWLKDHIWRYGKALDPREIIETACGEPFDASYYVNYLTNKYTDLYQL